VKFPKKVVAVLLGAMGASGALLASTPAQASFGPGGSSAREEEVAFHSARQSRSIEALEDYLWRFPEGRGNPELRMRAIFELAKFECVGSPNSRGSGCAPDGAIGHDNRAGGYGAG
jgi:hypothetical protein